MATTTETTTETTVYEVPEQNLAGLREAFDKLCKRARRLGVPEPTFAVTFEAVRELREWRDPVGDMVYREMNWMPTADQRHTATGRVERWFGVTVQGEAPRLPGGWQFVATLSPLPQEGGEAVNLIQTVPGMECPGEYAKPHNVGRCDQCSTKRYRKETFVVQNTAGETRAVGRNCLKDFLGHSNPERLASWATWLCELDTVCGGYCERGGRAVETYTLEDYLTTVAQVVSVRGFLGKGRAMDEGGTSTAEWVALLYDANPFGDSAKQEKAELINDIRAKDNTEAMQEQAQAAIAWALAMDVDAMMEQDGESYLLNLALIARAGVVGRKTTGLAASMPTAYMRAMDKLKERAARPASQHIGTPKQREDFVVRVDRVFITEGFYGTTYIYKLTGNVMADAGDLVNDITWFASSEADMEEGNTYRIKATVKEHGDYNGRPQTVVNRAKVLECVGEAE